MADAARRERIVVDIRVVYERYAEWDPIALPPFVGGDLREVQDRVAAHVIEGIPGVLPAEDGDEAATLVDCTHTATFQVMADPLGTAGETEGEA